MSDVMSVRLHLWGVRVRRVLSRFCRPSRGRSGINPGVVEVPHIAGSAAIGSGTGERSRVRDLGVSGRRAPRWSGGVAGSNVRTAGERHLEDHDQFAEPGLTRRFARRLVADARVMSMSGSVGRHHGVGWHRIMGLVRAEAAVVAQRRRARSRVVCCWSTKRRYGAGTGM